MAELDNVNPLSPLWPVRPPEKGGPRKRPPEKPDGGEKGPPKDDSADDEPPHVDEYA